MAIDLASLFANLGKVIKASNTAGTQAATLKALHDEVVAEFDSDAQGHNLVGLTDTVRGLAGAFAGYRSTLAGSIAQQRLVDRLSILNELDLRDASVATVLEALGRHMLAASASIDRSVVTIGSVTAGSANIGDGVILLNKVLDGVSSPRDGAASFPWYLGMDSELALTETMTFVVTSDSKGGGATEGGERLSWSGEVPRGSVWDETEVAEGSGSGPTLIGSDGASLVRNGFEGFTSAGVPTGWTLASGDVEANTAVVLRGTSSLQINEASKLTIPVQPVAGARYALLMWHNATSTGSGDLTLQLEGTGYTPDSGELITVASGAWSSGAWQMDACWLNVPFDRPSDLVLALETDGAGVVRVDGLALVRATYFGGIAGVAVPGEVAWVVGDRYTAAVSNAHEGTFQRWFMRAFGVQLPSAAGAAETIADSLAE